MAWQVSFGEDAMRGLAVAGATEVEKPVAGSCSRNCSAQDLS